jgi:hypothetical protein
LAASESNSTILIHIITGEINFMWDIIHLVTIFCNFAVTNNWINSSGHKTSTTTEELHNSFFLEINFAQLIEASAGLEEE